MFRAVLVFLMILVVSPPVAAQDLRALARVMGEGSSLRDGSGGGVELSLALSQAVPYRAFVLDAPARLVVDFREVTWTGLPEGFDEASSVTDVATGRGDAGWSRMVLSLSAPLGIARAEMRTDEVNGTALVSLSLAPVSQAEFAESAAHVPPGVRLPPVPVVDAPDPGRGEALLMIALDPGHGGVDPGAQRRGQDEADLMLIFAIELREVLLRSGLFDVVLTREGDWFVSLPERVTIARGAGAAAFISLHADALAAGDARGATVYTLSETASDLASEALAESHDRADLLAGVDLAGSDDEVADILIDLARLETAPRSDSLADHIVEAMDGAGVELHPHPRLEAGFSVLKAADIPSVLVELGFISDMDDLANLMDPEWRETVQEAIRDALVAWAIADEARVGLMRQ